MNYYEEALRVHKENKGKLEIRSKVKIENRDDLSIAYTPGVAEPCKEIYKNKAEVYKYTAKGNLVAVVSDGTAVLGLGNIGPEAAIPVMEGKAVLLKKFGNVDAISICLDTKDTEEIIKTVKYLAPNFGGINLEDICSPKCFEIERRLEEELDIPVFHDDQHGTAIVVTAALINALKIVNKSIEEIKVVLNGPGAAGTAIIKMLLHLGVKNIIACDENGILHKDRGVGIVEHKKELCEVTNKDNLVGDLKEAVKDADVFIGVSIGNILTKDMVQTMNKDAIVFAMANPVPEIMYEDAMEAGVKVMGTGRSDYPNQINNVLAFPGIFRGALDARARNITYNMKLAAAHAIAGLVSEEEIKPDYIIPNVFDKRVAPVVAAAVSKVAIDTGVSKIIE